MTMKEDNRPKILITNDDGIYAQGIKHLWRAVKDYDLSIVAPHAEQSGVGLSITTRTPLQIEELDWGEEKIRAWSVTGTPADCVKLALHLKYEKHPDLIVSGINRGNNAGRSLLYSGTVAGVIEGALRGIPGIAFSCTDYQSTNYEIAESYIPKIVDYILKYPLPHGTLLNVNFPSTPDGKIKGVKFTSQGKEYWGDNPTVRHHPVEGHAYYWIGSRLVEFEEEEDCDITWLKRGFVTAVPVQVMQFTDLAHLTQFRNTFNTYFN